tara:strand:- start:1734 stop:2468 length:735 start_codon:yes stop_codon:yes gene_type:complete
VKNNVYNEMPDGMKFSYLTPTMEGGSRYTIVTFHTSGEQGRHYEEEAAEWLECLQKHGYDQSAVILDAGDRPHWRNCTMLKAEVVLWAMLEYRTPILWLDADARVSGPLTIFDEWTGEDIGLNLRRDNGQGVSAWSGATIYFNESMPAIALATRWARFAGLATRGEGPYADAEGDQEILGFLAVRMIRDKRLSMKNIGPSWSWIYDRDHRLHPDKQPVIVQTQASRRRADVRIGGMRCLEDPAR